MSSPSVNVGQSTTDVYTGVWINWTNGKYVGATLTLSNSWGLVLVSFLAIFVGATGGHLWGIMTYLLHQSRAGSKLAKDGLFHQEQTVLRNSSSASASLWEFLKMGWAWRERANYSMWRMVPLSLLATVQLVVFAIAGIFSSEIFSTDQEVLVRSPSCGFMTLPSFDSIGSFTATDYARMNAFDIEARTRSSWSLAYARSCYGNNSVSCEHFAVPQIESTYGVTSCPFDSEMCLDPENGALWADTGLINTNYQLGINSKPELTIDYRRVTTCAPLTTENFVTLDEYGYLHYNYGGRVITGEPYDYTWGVNENSTTIPYAPMGSFIAYAADSSNSWTPIAKLNRTDADVTIIFVSSNAQYYGKSSPIDLWYNGGEKTEDIYLFGKGRPAYKNPNPVIVMGCTEQHQLCQGNGTTCSPLTGWGILGQLPLWTDKQQLDVATNLFSGLQNSFLYNMIFNLGTNALLASLYVDGAITLASNPLPSEFWKEEIKSWQNYCMAYVQRAMTDIAKGPANPAFRQFIEPPYIGNETDPFDICQNVKIRDGRFYSFKIIGLAITLIGGCLIILTNCFLSTFVGWIQRKFRKGLDRREDWELDHLLQLQRMAFDGAKLGTWARNEGSVPVTIKALGMQKFGKPGRGVGAYESVDSPEWYGDPISGLSPSSGFTEYMGKPIDEAYLMGPYKKGPSANIREFV